MLYLFISMSRFYLFLYECFRFFIYFFFFFCFNLFIWNNICKLIERTIQVSMSGNPEKYIYIFFNVMEINKCNFHISNLVLV